MNRFHGAAGLGPAGVIGFSLKVSSSEPRQSGIVESLWNPESLYSTAYLLRR